jgi:membrane protease subunit (stomatin/prohibitin family)
MAITFIEIIEAATPDPNLLMWKFADEDKEIKNGARLTVRESQHAILLNEGLLADVFGPGLHKLSTENIPLLSRLKGWKFGFESPYKADVYFFNTHQFINNKWGTPAPILIQDEQFGQVRIRAFGSFDIKINNPGTFFKQYCGTYKQLTIFELQQQLRDVIAPAFGEILAQQKIPITEVAGNLSLLSKKIAPLLSPYLEQLGLLLVNFFISSVTLPEEVTAFYDKMTSMNMVKDMDKFTKFQTANAIGIPGTAPTETIRQAMIMNMVMTQMQQNASNTNPAKPGGQDDIISKLESLKKMYNAQLLDKADYKRKKEELLTKL